MVEAMALEFGRHVDQCRFQLAGRPRACGELALRLLPARAQRRLVLGQQFDQRTQHGHLLCRARAQHRLQAFVERRFAAGQIAGPARAAAQVGAFGQHARLFERVAQRADIPGV